MTGYKDPPREHQWGPGKSGNPAGRRGKKGTVEPPAQPSTTLSDIVMQEAYRLVEIREGGKVERIPMIQANIRRLGVAGAQGHLPAARTIIGFVQSIEQRRFDEHIAFFESLRAYKKICEDNFASDDRAGRPRRNPVPHPDDLVLDTKSGMILFNGPISQFEKEEWDTAFAQMAGYEAELAACTKEARRRGINADEKANLERRVAMLKEAINEIAAVYPPEKLRRRRGFDIDVWRRQQAIILGTEGDALPSRKVIGAPRL